MCHAKFYLYQKEVFRLYKKTSKASKYLKHYQFESKQESKASYQKNIEKGRIKKKAMFNVSNCFEIKYVDL